MAALRDEPVGELRIAAPSGFAGGVLGRALAPLLAANPGLSLRLFFQDEMIDLVQHRIDLALRAGIQPDSSLVARHLADWPFVLVAAPAYLATRGTPQQPGQLYQHDWIGLEQDHGLAPLRLQREGEVEVLRLRCRIASNSMLSARAFALDGLGIAMQPAPEVKEELAVGRLQQVLPDWLAPVLPVYVVTPRRDVLPAKVRHAIALLQQAFI
jgi:DNA-binding transcriptional LysR family regulator